MEKTNVYEDQHLRLEYVKEGNYLHETWLGITVFDTFSKLMDIISSKLHSLSADGVLLDAREHRGISPEAQKYAAKTISSYAKYHGKFKEAVIVPKDVFSRFSVEEYSKKVTDDSPVHIKFFDDITSAHLWLIEEED
jgi:hypothetical protein